MRNHAGLFTGLLLWACLAATAVLAHEVRPASLDIVEQESGALDFRWRQPINGEYGIAIRPRLSSGWLDAEPHAQFTTESSLIRLWTVRAPTLPLGGQTLQIDGLDRTITDVLLTITDRQGVIHTQLIKAAEPTTVLPPLGQAEIGIPQYLWLGLVHIWEGPDHLLYVLGLMLLIGNPRTLLLTITAFTLAHSLTLAGATLGLVSLRSAPVEAVIALSIVYVAVEAVHAQRGRPSLASRNPWLIAFLFGLLHGFGFAGALQDIGLPQQALAMTLLLFNVGIELGQVLFVILVLGVSWIGLGYLPDLTRRLHAVAPWAIGSMASYWFLQRVLVLM